MAHTLFKLRSKVFNTPQLMNTTEFETVVQYLNDRCSGKMEVDSYRDEEDSEQEDGRYSYNPDAQAAVINLYGPTTYRPTFWASICGGFDYETLKEDFVQLAEQGVKVVAFHMDSPGGEAHQMMATANFIREVANEKGIDIITYVDGLAASAGYGIACVSDQIIMSSDSEVGSIGVVVRLMNDSKKLENDGYQRTFITAGKSKVPFDKEGQFTQDFIEDIQYKVDNLYEEFTEHVAKHRNVSVEAVRSTEAKTFLPSTAIELGLADGVMTVEQFYTHLADIAQQRQGNEPPMLSKSKLFQSKEETTDMTQLAKMQEQEEVIASLQAQLSEAQESVAELTAVKEQLEEMEELASATEASLKEAQAQLEAVEKEKEQLKAEARKEKLSAVLAADQVDSVAEALSSLDEAAFEAVVGSYAASAKAAEGTAMFQELGGAGAEAEQTIEEDTTTRMLKQRFAQ